MHQVLHNISIRYPDHNIPFWDTDQLEAYDLIYFDDPNHLSIEGKNRYSEYFSSKLIPYLR